MDYELQSSDIMQDAEILDKISRLLMNTWPTIRKKFVNINALQTACNMPISHIQLLCMLNQETALSITQISERFGIAKPNITPMVDRLIADGLVIRTRSNQDKRIVTVVICDRGHEKLREIHYNLCQILLDWSKDLADKQLLELYEALSTIVRLICIKD